MDEFCVVLEKLEGPFHLYVNPLNPDADNLRVSPAHMGLLEEAVGLDPE